VTHTDSQMDSKEIHPTHQPNASSTVFSYSQPAPPSCKLLANSSAHHHFAHSKRIPGSHCVGYSSTESLAPRRRRLLYHGTRHVLIGSRYCEIRSFVLHLTATFVSRDNRQQPVAQCFLIGNGRESGSRHPDDSTPTSVTGNSIPTAVVLGKIKSFGLIQLSEEG